MNQNIEQTDTSLPFDKIKQKEEDFRKKATAQIQMKNKDEIARRSLERSANKSI